MHFQRLGFDKLLRNSTCAGQIRIQCTLSSFKWGFIISYPINDDPVELLDLLCEI